jgi:UDP-GlcNAc:undecaprenyl-phosphate GlcNAc-1-phosphate transferase
MAIFRRWVRNLPLSSADRRHVHHLLIGLGLNPRQAAILLYCFSAGLCGVVLLGVVYKNEVLALVMGLSGCLAFLLILTSRRDELTTLRSDFQSRLVRGKQERFAAKVTWEAIQRVELSESLTGIWEIMKAATDKLGCDRLSLDCSRDGQTVFAREGGASEETREAGSLSGPEATFRLSSGRDLLFIVSIHQSARSSLEADIAFRFVQRLSLASAERLERLFSKFAEPDPVVDSDAERNGLKIAPLERPTGIGSTALGLVPSPSARPSMGWLREALGWSSSPVSPARSLGEK